MSPYRPKGRTIWRVHVPTRLGNHIICGTGTRHRPTAVAMGRMVHELGPRGKREWDLLEAVTTRSVSLATLYDAYRMGELAGFRARLADLDLEPLLGEWFAWLTENRAPLTLESYRQKVRSLMPAGVPFLRSTLTAATVRTWLAVPGVSTSTQRSYLAALQAFIAFAASRNMLTTDVLRDLVPPRITVPPVRFLELDDVRRLVDASPTPERVVFALLYGGALEISAALVVTKRHLDPAARSVRAAGTKTYTRDRVAMLADWAWPIVADYARPMLPDAPLFPGLTRGRCGKVHRAVLQRVGLRPRAAGRVGVTMHDARHHWAVRMLRAGAPVEIVARQLGHASAKMTLDIYGRFVPNYAELREWEARAMAMDVLRTTATVGATGPRAAEGNS